MSDTSNGGASSVRRYDDDPLCSFDPDNGFTLNENSLDTLRWYSYLDDEAPAGDGEERTS